MAAVLKGSKEDTRREAGTLRLEMLTVLNFGSERVREVGSSGAV